MNDPIIVTTPAQLREIVADEVAAILPKLADFRRKNEPVETDGKYTKTRFRTRNSDAARCSRKRSF